MEGKPSNFTNSTQNVSTRYFISVFKFSCIKLTLYVIIPNNITLKILNTTILHLWKQLPYGYTQKAPKLQSSVNYSDFHYQQKHLQSVSIDCFFPYDSWVAHPAKKDYIIQVPERCLHLTVYKHVIIIKY